MKTLLLALLIIPLAYAQQLQPVSSLQADCGKFLQPAILTAGTFNSATVDNRSAGCDGWVVTYSSFNFATVSVTLQDAPLTTAGAAGTFVSFAGAIVIGFVNPAIATPQGEIRATGYYPYVRIQITTTGTGYLTAEFHGFKTNPNSGGGGSGSGCPGTVGTPCVVDGPDASGASPTQNPVAVAGLDTNNGNVVRPLLLDFFGGTLAGSTSISPSSLGSTTAIPFFQSSNSGNIGAGGVGMGIYSLPIIPTADGVHFAQAPGDATLGPLVQAQGPTAAGSPPTKNPVLIAGQDGTNIQMLKTGSGANNLGVLTTTQGVAQVMLMLGDPAGAAGAVVQSAVAEGTGDGATGRNSVQVGQNVFTSNAGGYDRVFACANQVFVNLAASGNAQVIAASGSTKIRICHIHLSTSAPETIQLTTGTGANCVTGNAVIDAYQNTSTLAMDFQPTAALRGAASQALCVNPSANTTLTGVIVYAQF